MSCLHPPYVIVVVHGGFLGGLVVKNLTASAGDVGFIPESERPPGEGSGNPLQHFCLENPWAEESGRLQSMGCKRVNVT